MLIKADCTVAKNIYYLVNMSKERLEEKTQNNCHMYAKTFFFAIFKRSQNEKVLEITVKMCEAV